MQKKAGKKSLVSLILLSLILMLAACGGLRSDAAQTEEQPYLRVDFVDVGQADFILVECDGVYMTIDGGNTADSMIIYSLLKERGIEEIDTVVITHAHEDHYGGVSAILNYAKVNRVYCSVDEYVNGAFGSVLEAISREGLEITIPVPGEAFTLGSALVQILGPVDTYEDPNNMSIVLKITFGDRSFLFTGDAEREAENDIINAGFDISADVLKVGHHGSYTSTSYVWLKTVDPQYAVISSNRGEFPEYNHPHEEVVSRLRDKEVTVYRTDLQGTVTLITYGDEIAFFVERNPDADTLFDAGDGNRHS